MTNKKDGAIIRLYSRKKHEYAFLIGIIFAINKKLYTKCKKSILNFQEAFMLQKEGQVRIPAGCAISGFISRDGNRVSGDKIVKSISYMHDRSNGLGGGFAGYGIYPEYADQYAFHIFYDSNESRVETEAFLDRHFDVVNLSRIPTRKHKNITGEPLIW